MSEMVSILPYVKEAGLLLPVVVLMMVVVYTPKIIALIDSWKLRKVNYLSTLHSNELLDAKTQAMLQREINNAAFQSIYGFRVETKLREALCRLNTKSPEVFTWKRLRMAALYIEQENDGIVVKLHWYDRLINLIAILGALMVLGVILFSWMSFGMLQDISSLSTAVFISLVFGVLFMLYAYQIAQSFHARKLREDLEALNEVKHD